MELVIIVRTCNLLLPRKTVNPFLLCLDPPQNESSISERHSKVVVQAIFIKLYNFLQSENVVLLENISKGCEGWTFRMMCE